MLRGRGENGAKAIPARSRSVLGNYWADRDACTGAPVAGLIVTTRFVLFLDVR